jgi:hypothetical protein
MKTIRFYNMFSESVVGSQQVMTELRLSVPEDIDLNDMFDVLSQKTGYPIESFSYENVRLDN